jgi:hypothetical protein
MNQQDTASATVTRNGDRNKPSIERSPLLTGLAVLGFAVPVALYFWLISSYAVDMLRVDQWADVGLIRRSFDGTLGVGALWSQYGQNRIFFQNLITLLVAHQAHFNVLVEVYISAVFLTAALALFILAHRRRSPSTPWIAYCPVAFVLLTVAQWGGALYGFTIGWYIIMLGLAVALFFIDRPTLTWVALAAAMCAAVVASYSSLQGLFIWPVGLVLLLQRARDRRFVLSWVVVAVATTIGYFYKWKVEGGGSLSYALHHLGKTVEVFFFEAGDILGRQITNHPNSEQYAIFLFGVIVVGVGLYSILMFGLRVDVSSGRPLGVALVLFGLLFAAGAAGSRVDRGVSHASFSLFVIFDVLILIGSYLVIIDRSERKVTGPVPNRLWLVATVVVGVLMGVQIVSGTASGISNARSYHRLEVSGAITTAKIKSAPDYEVRAYLAPNGTNSHLTVIRELTAYARLHRLSLFSTNESQWYASQAIPIPEKHRHHHKLEGADQ